MTQVHFTLNNEEVQSIIEHSVKDDVSKNILTTIFNQLMEEQRTEYIQAQEYERTNDRKGNGMTITSERIPHVLERLNEPSHGQEMVNSHRPFLSVTSGTKKPFWLLCWRCMFLASPLEKFRKSSKRSVENPSLNPLFQR